jgi:hypothetical protein
VAEVARGRWRSSASILVLAILGISATACQPASAASISITNPTTDEVAYGYLDVRVRAVDVDPQSV